MSGSPQPPSATSPAPPSTSPSPVPHPTPSQTSILLSPVPQPQPVPTVSLPHTFQTPSKRISSASDLRRFLFSRTSSSFLGFIASLSRSSIHLKLSDALPLSHALSSLLSLLSSLSLSVDEIPPLPHPSRYGNPAFRLWHQRLAAGGPSLVLPLLPERLRPALPELLPYLLDSFGNPTRIDYGTGHETNFAAFLYCLARLDLIAETDYAALALRVFVSYLELMRKLQDTYSLEPAGSHGVWGLDDYHFLPFIFGSAQLVDHKYIKPKSIHNEDVMEHFSKEYLYLDCVARVKKVKKGVFAEHSPLLNDISGVATWSKVNSGLLKMYRAEVLEKVPIMQHFLFGSLIEWE